uniref:Uncharacterized protein n=1 Tax=Cucumis sativus TaxID=3659 RepID=A0A0A0M393_CUCSA
MIEVSTPPVSQQHSGTCFSKSTSPAASSARLFASANVNRAQGEGYGNMNFDQGMMNFNPPNYHDSSSQISFPCEAGIGNLMSEDNAYNTNCYQFAVVTNHLGSDYFPLAVPPTTPTFAHTSNVQVTLF